MSLHQLSLPEMSWICRGKELGEVTGVEGEELAERGAVSVRQEPDRVSWCDERSGLRWKTLRV